MWSSDDEEGSELGFHRSPVEEVLRNCLPGTNCGVTQRVDEDLHGTVTTVVLGVLGLALFLPSHGIVDRTITCLVLCGDCPWDK